MRQVLVVGPDHQNTLGIIRALGKEKYIVDLIVYGSNLEKCRCRKSKYLTGKYVGCAENEREIVETIIRMANIDRKVPVIPTSDYAEMCIDKNYNILCKYCVLPSISNTEGLVCHYMDKYAQKKLAEKYNIKMAKSIRLNLMDNWEEKISLEWTYPCVIKPLVSAKGLKSDISYINSLTELIEKCNGLKQAGYEDVLIQEFIKKDYEVCMFGCLTKNTQEFFGGAIKKIRYSPVGDGASLSFAQFIKVDNKILEILSVLRKLGYNGLFDVEFFVVNEELYLNEINFRNSGNGWAVVNREINFPDIWIRDCLGERIVNKKHFINDNSYFMNETADLKNVLKGNIRLFTWVKCLIKTRSFNKFWIRDILGSLIWYRR